MKKADKQDLIDNLKERFSQSNYFYLADASGLTVEEVNALRRVCFQQGVIMQVAKNTLIRKALEADGKFSDELDQLLHGPTAIMFAENGKLPAKIIKEFRKSGKKKPVLKGAFIDTAIYTGDDQIDVLLALKSKEELIGEIIGLLQSPARNVISALQSGGGKLAGILKTLSEREQS